MKPSPLIMTISKITKARYTFVKPNIFFFVVRLFFVAIVQMNLYSTYSSVNPECILKFWFIETDKDLHFRSTREFDHIIALKFKHMVDTCEKAFNYWDITSSKALMASILISDQFSRHVYRGSSSAFKNDRFAKQCTLKLISKSRWENEWTQYQCMFAILPLMHSEDLKDQESCIKLLTKYGPSMSLHYAKDHLDVIKRFGRFPHRNKALGRTTTLEEKKFIKTRANWPSLK